MLCELRGFSTWLGTTGIISGQYKCQLLFIPVWFECEMFPTGSCIGTFDSQLTLLFCKVVEPLEYRPWVQRVSRKERRQIVENYSLALFLSQVVRPGCVLPPWTLAGLPLWQNLIPRSHYVVDAVRPLSPWWGKFRVHCWFYWWLIFWVDEFPYTRDAVKRAPPQISRDLSWASVSSQGLSAAWFPRTLRTPFPLTDPIGLFLVPFLLKLPFSKHFPVYFLHASSQCLILVSVSPW